MAQSMLRLYRLDSNYAQVLRRADHRVMSCDPAEGKEARPLVGIVVPHAGRKYCIPLSSPKPKHVRMKADRDFSKIVDRSGRLIGVLNFNNMVPVCDSVLIGVDLNPYPSDTVSERAYKELMRDQLRWCNDNRDLVRRKAAKLYSIVTERPQAARQLVNRCCDFLRLEQVLDRWMDSSL